MGGIVLIALIGAPDRLVIPAIVRLCDRFLCYSCPERAHHRLSSTE